MKKVFIIAEAGVNHNGSLATAKKLIDAAAAAGCDAVKFQTFRAKDIVSRDAPAAAYQRRNMGPSVSQYDMLRKLELSERDHRSLSEYCRKKRIIFMSTPFDIESAEMLKRLGMKIFKIASGEITNKPLIQKIASMRKPIIMSTGMSYGPEVAKAMAWIKAAWKGKPNVTLLHCVSDYPASFSDTNLKAMPALGRRYRTAYGLSDHTCGIEAPIAAAAMGASVIEKHFTLDRKMKGPDHKASLKPDELRSMAAAVRNIEAALGDGVKRPARAELDARKVARKSLTAARHIKKGSAITSADLCAKRPGTGIPPEKTEKIVGRRAKADILKDTQIKFSSITGRKA